MAVSASLKVQQAQVDAGGTKRTADAYLEMASNYMPGIKRVLSEHGNVPVVDYVSAGLRVIDDAYQDRSDVAAVVYEYVAGLLGEESAQRAFHEILRCPVALTANHHGIDYFAQSVQGTLLYSLSKMGVGSKLVSGYPNDRAVIVFACGNVPLNNLVYPRGLSLYGIRGTESIEFPKKLPIFPDRFKRDMVSVVRGFNREMVSRSMQRTQRLVSESDIDSAIAIAATDILQRDYSHNEVLKLESYSEQAVVVNNRLWPRLFAEEVSAPELIYLELEAVTGMLLQKDLMNSASLAAKVLLDHDVRSRIIAQLDGERACWDTPTLEQRFSKGAQQKLPENRYGGTVFFWGLDRRGRRIPLLADTELGGADKLFGIGDRGETFTVSLTPEGLGKALHEKRLLPSLFTCYLTIAFARGITSVGGYYQSAYLPVMQRGVVDVLQGTQGCKRMASHVANVPADCYISGMQTVMRCVQGDLLIPAGPVEIAAGGGLSVTDLEEIGRLTVTEAHTASLFETIPDAAPWAIGYPGWKESLAIDIAEKLEDRITIK